MVLAIASTAHGKEERGIGISSAGHSLKGVGRYYALLIGINDYQDRSLPGLKTPVPDVQELKDVLIKSYGFSGVTLLVNEQATKRSIDDAFRRLIRELGPDHSLLVYFAGHGELDRDTGGGWWIPYDAGMGEPTSYLDNAVVQKYIKALKAHHVLLISDSCYSGTLLGETRAFPSVIDDAFYRELHQTSSRWGMTSGNKTPVMDRGSGGHSLFAYNLIKTLRENKKPYLTPRQIYTKIGPIIRNNSDQMPLCLPMRNAGDAGGEFVFIRFSPLSFQVNFIYRSQGKGEAHTIENGTTLNSGDHYKIVFTPDRDCYVYVFQVDSADQIFQLFPLKAFKGVMVNNLNPVSQGKRYVLPAENKAFRLDRNTGRERIYFIASRDRDDRLENLYRELTRPRTQQDGDARSKLKQYFRRRGVGGITTSRSITVTWEETKEAPQDVFSVVERRLDDLCAECVHAVEFMHK